MCPQQQQNGQRAVQAAAYQFKQGPDVPERAIAALPYLLPLLDALPYGRYVFLQFPFIARAMAPLAPVAYLYNSVPFLPFILFIGVYSFIVNNQSMGRFIRYNAMQAVLLDILLIIPSVLMSSVLRPPEGGVALQLYEQGLNTIFLFVAVSVAYGMGSCAVGQTPRLPLVADAASKQLGGDGPSGL
ncbi:hypothetical protein OEZ86_009568 [Tetradesmus obliquus]|uniref:Protein TIC 20 n=1 Tax=Tetradesmus obliquus TaxID=3088 RepID=A0ABY8UM18_TETOB|nr:hypothetical protein OEZ85_001013 [Tetradesmus obliquus]WIA43035.1 hypothetical protein OEZ86_009568 [Tetradesmus obliquus]